MASLNSEDRDDEKVSINSDDTLDYEQMRKDLDDFEAKPEAHLGVDSDGWDIQNKCVCDQNR